jgi:hypothetical protein
MRKTLAERERAIAGVEAAMLRGEGRPYVIVRLVEGVKSYRTAKRFMETIRERWRATNAGVAPPPQRGRAEPVPRELSEAELTALRDRILEEKQRELDAFCPGASHLPVQILRSKLDGSDDPIRSLYEDVDVEQTVSVHLSPARETYRPSGDLNGIQILRGFIPDTKSVK